ncbi:MAG: hypothetical protein FWC43_12185 [Planctomycetaceae bacterium]|nr:hypothetical protein [Planctomycetaceae bacterium]
MLGVEVSTLILAQCPVLAALIWFLVKITRENYRHMEKMQEQFQHALEKIVDRITDHLGRIEHDVTVLTAQNQLRLTKSLNDNANTENHSN